MAEFPQKWWMSSLAFGLAELEFVVGKMGAFFGGQQIGIFPPTMSADNVKLIVLEVVKQGYTLTLNGGWGGDGGLASLM